tara:strand:- start:1060 stop:1902 length:843 start_codon:yes stop_codon:yes gene_type:complete
MQKEYFKNLTKEEKYILKDKGTEPPFSGEYNDFYDAGVFVCRACKAPLYESNTKFNSGCGWPSFDDEIKGALVRHEDLSLGRKRTEICCAKCDGHLGHVFHGEKITKKNTRHCVNSLSIQFKPYNNLQKVTLGGGCFWSLQQIYKNTKGVYLTQCGYMGGNTINPSYDEVCSGNTNHAEVVEIYFDDSVISFEKILDIFWDSHDPTTINRQGNDIGTQYRSIIFYESDQQKKLACDLMKNRQSKFEKKIVTQITHQHKFYRAEEYHQNYFDKNNLSGCSI